MTEEQREKWSEGENKGILLPVILLSGNKNVVWGFGEVWREMIKQHFISG